MTKIRDSVLKSKPFLMIGTIIVSALHILGFFNYPFWLFFGWTLLVLLCDLPEMLKEYFKKHLLFSIMMVSLLIGFVLNISISDSTGLLNIWLIFQNYYVLFCGNRDKDLNDKTAKYTLLFLTVIFFIYSFINLIDFTLGFNWFPQDLVYSRLSGIYSGPNQMGVCAGISLFATLPLFTNKNILIKLFALLNVLLQAYMAVLSNTRSVLLAFLVIVLGCVFFYIYKRVNKTVFIFTLVAGGLIACAGIVYIGIGRFFMQNQTYIFDFALPDLINKISAGRYYIWQDALKVFTFKPIFGIGPLNLYTAAHTYLPGGYIDTTTIQNVHNCFIELLVYGGLCSFIPFVIWLGHKYLTIVKNFILDPLFLSCFFISIVLLFLGLLDVAIVYDTHCYTYVFWFSIGYCYQTITNDEVKS